MLWRLVQPPENGGLGMSPSEAKKLTPAEAVFYLTSEDAIKRECTAQNMADPAFAAEFNSQRNSENLREYMRELRKKFTGKEEL